MDDALRDRRDLQRQSEIRSDDGAYSAGRVKELELSEQQWGRAAKEAISILTALKLPDLKTVRSGLGSYAYDARKKIDDLENEIQKLTGGEEHGC